jgi:SAM-dependent methyltransferase
MVKLTSQKVLESYNEENAQKYKKTKVFDGTYLLAYRDIPAILKRFVRGKRAIDYGCGTGRSTRFLKDLGYETIGVDISKEMLEQALSIDKKNHYCLVENAKIPVLDDSCDLIFACYVVCAIPTREELIAVFEEVHRCLKKGGIFVAVTACDDFYTGNWLSYDVDFPENKNLKSGDPAKFYLKDLDVELTNYYWTHRDYCEVSAATSLKIVERFLPLGHPSDGMDWVSETEHPPYAIYVSKK